MTYHFNNGNGATPGTIGLRNTASGQTVGTWSAIGAYHTFDTTPGATWSATGDGPPYLSWNVQPKITVDPGNYEVVDSSPSTWSTNSEVGNRGIAFVLGWDSTTSATATTATTTSTTTAATASITPVKISMTANNAKNISVSTSTPVKINIAVDPDSNTTRADWWLAYGFADKVLWLDPVAGFTQKIVPVYQGNLFPITTTTIIESTLPEGNHAYCLAIDQKADAQLTAESLSYDCVTIAVSPTSSVSGSTSSGTNTPVIGSVTLPTGSTFKPSDLVVLTNTNYSGISTNGTYLSSAAPIGTSGSTLAMVTTAAGNPVLLKQVLADGSNSSAPVDARSTAEALVLYDPVFLRLPAADQKTARNNLASHTKLSELVGAIESAIKTDPNDPLNVTNHRTIYELAVLISKDLIDKLPQPKTVEKMDSSNYVGVNDDESQNQPTIFLINNSYAYFDVTIKKSGTVVNTPQYNTFWRIDRKHLLKVAFEWPPVKLNEAVALETSLGDGDFTFDFAKQSGLSIFDGLMSLASTIIGVKGDSAENLDAGYKVLISSGQKLTNVINKLITQKPNTKEEAKAIFYDVMISNTGLTDLLDYAKSYFAAKIVAEIQNSWFKAVVRFTASKFVVWGTGAYGGADVAAIMLSVAQAPDTYSENGTQRSGKYPASPDANSWKKVKVKFNVPINTNGAGSGSCIWTGDNGYASKGELITPQCTANGSVSGSIDIACIDSYGTKMTATINGSGLQYLNSNADAPYYYWSVGGTKTKDYARSLKIDAGRCVYSMGSDFSDAYMGVNSSSFLTVYLYP